MMGRVHDAPNHSTGQKSGQKQDQAKGWAIYPALGALQRDSSLRSIEKANKTLTCLYKNHKEHTIYLYREWPTLMN
jgi:hypothetical protein